MKVFNVRFCTWVFEQTINTTSIGLFYWIPKTYKIPVLKYNTGVFTRTGTKDLTNMF